MVCLLILTIYFQGWFRSNIAIPNRIWLWITFNIAINARVLYKWNWQVADVRYRGQASFSLAVRMWTFMLVGAIAIRWVPLSFSTSNSQSSSVPYSQAFVFATSRNHDVGNICLSLSTLEYILNSRSRLLTTYESYSASVCILNIFHTKGAFLAVHLLNMFNTLLT